MRLQVVMCAFLALPRYFKVKTGKRFVPCRCSLRLPKKPSSTRTFPILIVVLVDGIRTVLAFLRLAFLMAVVISPIASLPVEADLYRYKQTCMFIATGRDLPKLRGTGRVRTKYESLLSHPLRLSLYGPT